MPSSRLTPAEEAAWRGFHEMRNLLLPRITRDLAADSGLTEADYSILLALVEAPDRALRSAELLKRLQWEPSRLSHQISRMEGRGTISRSKCPDDARSFLVGLTEKGLDAIRGATPGHLSAVRRWFVDALTPAQLAAFAEIADSVTSHIASVDARVDVGRADASQETLPAGGAAPLQ